MSSSKLDDSSEIDNNIKKLRVKELKGSSYVISLEKKDLLGTGIYFILDD